MRLRTRGRAPTRKFLVSLLGAALLTGITVAPVAAQTSSEREFLRFVKLMVGVVVPEIKNTTALDRTMINAGRNVCKLLDEGNSVKAVTLAAASIFSSYTQTERAIIVSGLVVGAKSHLCPRHKNKQY